MRNVFYSFHYKPDSHRAARVRSIGALTGNRPASDNDWEKVATGGDSAIEAWIDGQMVGRTCAVVLVGAQTAGRKWIKYEIEKAWKDGKGVVGIHVHNLEDLNGNTVSKGLNPFSSFTFGDKQFDQVAKCYDPGFVSSKYVYSHIADNIEAWIEEAITIRKNN